MCKSPSPVPERTCTDKAAFVQGTPHDRRDLRCCAARGGLGDAEMRVSMMSRNVKAREYAEDVDDDNTYLGAAKRKSFGIIYYGIYGGIVAWT